jgi:hypothetical protein
VQFITKLDLEYQSCLQLELSLSVAPAQGVASLATYFRYRYIKGQGLGDVVVQYRAAAWFDWVEATMDVQEKVSNSEVLSGTFRFHEQ